MSETETVTAKLPSTSEAEDSFFRAIAEGMQDAVYVRDKDRTILYINPAAAQMTGWKEIETAVHPCYRVFGDPDQRCNLECPIDQAIADGKAARHKEGTVTRRDGTVVPVEVSITPLPKSFGQARAVVILRDIGRVRGLEDAHLNVLREFEEGVRQLKLDETRFRDFADLSNEWLWETDAEHRFTLITGKAFFGRESYLGKRRQDLVDVVADKALWAPFFKWLENEKPFTGFVYPATGPSGERGWVSISGKPIYDERNTFIGYCGIGQNIAEDTTDA